MGRSQWSGRAGRGCASTPQPGRVAGRSLSPGHGPPGARGSGQAWPSAWATLPGMGAKAAPRAYLCHGPALPGDRAGRRPLFTAPGCWGPEPPRSNPSSSGACTKACWHQGKAGGSATPQPLFSFNFSLCCEPESPPCRSGAASARSVYLCCFKCIYQKDSC